MMETGQSAFFYLFINFINQVREVSFYFMSTKMNRKGLGTKLFCACSVGDYENGGRSRAELPFRFEKKNNRLICYHLFQQIISI